MQTLKVVVTLVTLMTFFSCDNSTSTKKTEVLAKNDSAYIDTSDVATEKVEIEVILTFARIA